MRRCILLLALSCLASPVLWAQPPQALIRYEKLDNQAVVKMVKDGIPDEAIIQEIKANSAHFDLSAAALASLKKAGVSEAVIAAMREAATAAPKSVSAEPQSTVSPPVQTAVAKADLPPTPSPPPAPDPFRRTTPEPAPVPVRKEVTSPPVTAPRQDPLPNPQPPAAYSHIEDEETPRAEIFGGFSITRLSGAEGNLVGWNAAVTGNVSRSFGLVGDISSQSENQTLLGYELGSANVYLLLFGPQFSFRSGKIHGFGRGLFGTSHNTLRTRTVDSWALVYGFGGGLDVGLSSGFAVRVLQWDAIVRSLERENRTDHRLSFGGVVRF